MHGFGCMRLGAPARSFLLQTASHMGCEALVYCAQVSWAGEMSYSCGKVYAGWTASSHQQCRALPRLPAACSMYLCSNSKAQGS